MKICKVILGIHSVQFLHRLFFCSVSLLLNIRGFLGSCRFYQPDLFLSYPEFPDSWFLFLDSGLRNLRVTPGHLQQEWRPWWLIFDLRFKLRFTRFTTALRAWYNSSSNLQCTLFLKLGSHCQRVSLFLWKYAKVKNFYLTCIFKKIFASNTY